MAVAASVDVSPTRVAINVPRPCSCCVRLIESLVAGATALVGVIASPAVLDAVLAWHVWLDDVGTMDQLGHRELMRVGFGSTEPVHATEKSRKTTAGVSSLFQDPPPSLRMRRLP